MRSLVDQYKICFLNASMFYRVGRAGEDKK